MALINKIEYKQSSAGFCSNMRPCLYICMGWKVFSLVCIMLQCDRICFSGSKQYSLEVLNIQINNLRMSFLFIQKSVKRSHISLSFFYTHRAVFNWHVWKYSKTIPKFLKYFIHLIRKMIFMMFVVWYNAH